MPTGNVTTGAPMATFTGGAAVVGAGAGILGLAGVVALVL